jgi:hypothetical protein
MSRQPPAAGTHGSTDAQWSNIAFEACTVFLASLLFPGLFHRMRWWTRLSARGTLVLILWRTFQIFAVRTWGPALVGRAMATGERIRQDAAAELRHDPSDEEVQEYVRRRDDR